MGRKWWLLDPNYSNSLACEIRIIRSSYRAIGNSRIIYGPPLTKNVVTICLCFSFLPHNSLPLPFWLSYSAHGFLGLLWLFLLSCPLDSWDLILAMGFDCTSHSLKFQPPPPLWNFLYLAPCTRSFRGQPLSESTGPLPLFHIGPSALSSALNDPMCSQHWARHVGSSLAPFVTDVLLTTSAQPSKCSSNTTTIRPSSSLLEMALLHSLPTTTYPFFHMNT